MGFLILCVIVSAIVMILRLLVGFIGAKMGWAAEIIGLLVQICTIIFWAAVCVAIIIIVGDMIMCLWHMGAPSLHLGNTR